MTNDSVELEEPNKQIVDSEEHASEADEPTPGDVFYDRMIQLIATLSIRQSEVLRLSEYFSGSSQMRV